MWTEVYTTSKTDILYSEITDRGCRHTKSAIIGKRYCFLGIFIEKNYREIFNVSKRFLRGVLRYEIDVNTFCSEHNCI